jgi:hypothetical protein
VVDFRATTFPVVSERISGVCATQGLQCLEISELTVQLLQASQQDELRHKRMLSRIPWGFRDLGRELMVMPGSKRHSSYVNGQRCYYLCLLQKLKK